MALLAIIALVAVALWYALARWFAGMLAGEDATPGRRLGALAIGGLLAIAVVAALATGVVAWLRHGMRF